MIEISFDKSFSRALKKLLKQNPAIEILIREKINLFIHNPFDLSLKTHKLSGKLRELYSFSIEYDCRIIFYFFEDKAVFIDIGKHDDVY